MAGETTPSANENHEALQVKANGILTDFEKKFPQGKLKNIEKNGEIDKALKRKLFLAQATLKSFKRRAHDDDYDAEFVENAISVLENFMKPELEHEETTKKAGEVLKKMKETDFYNELVNRVKNNKANKAEKKIYLACIKLENVEYAGDDLDVKNVQEQILLLENVLKEIRRDKLTRIALEDEREKQHAIEEMNNYIEDEKNFPLKIRTRYELINSYLDSTRNGEVPNSVPNNWVMRLIPNNYRRPRIDLTTGDYLVVNESIDLPAVQRKGKIYSVTIPDNAKILGEVPDGKYEAYISERGVHGNKQAEVLLKFSKGNVKECISLLERVKKYLEEKPDYNHLDDITSSIQNRIGELMGLRTGEILSDPLYDAYSDETACWYHFYSEDSYRAMTDESLQNCIDEIDETISFMRKGIKSAKTNENIFIDRYGRIITSDND